MGQILGPDSGVVTKVSGTQVKLLAGSRVSIMGQQFLAASDIFLNTGSVGVGGLDTGSLGSIQIWYVHAVVSAGALALVASLSKTAPTGFSVFGWTGWAFVTNDSSQVSLAVNSTHWDFQPFNMTITGSGSDPTRGVGFVEYARYARDGQFMSMHFVYRQVTAGSAGTGGYQFHTPGSLLIDVNAINPPTAAGIMNVLGYGTAGGGSNNFHAFDVEVQAPENGWVYMTDNTATNTQIGSAHYGFDQTNLGLSFFVKVPIQGWSANAL